MKHTFMTMVAAGILVSSCAPKTAPNSSADEFKKATIEQAKTSFKKSYDAELNESDVKVMSVDELDQWIKVSPWSTRDLPCEVKDILAAAREGSVDPSPIALDVSGSAPGGATGLVYIPIRSKVACDSPKSDFFLDDAAGCANDKKVMVCNGGIGGSCTCSCIFVCDAAPTDCDLC